MAGRLAFASLLQRPLRAFAAPDAGTRPRGPLEVDDLVRRTFPFGLAVAVALVALVMPPGVVSAFSLAVTLFLLCLCGAATYWAPWKRLPVWMQTLPALVFILALAFLRDAGGGASSGYSALVLIPILWMALHGTTRSLAVVLVANAAVLVAPALLNPLLASSYPVSELRGAVLWAMLGPIVGLTLQRLVGEMRNRAAEAARRAEQLRRNEASIATVARELTHGPDARRQICQAARKVAGALYAVLLEPDGKGYLVNTASSGSGLDAHMRIELGGEAVPSVMAFASHERVFVADANEMPASARERARRHGGVSLLFEPVLVKDRALAVLVVAWATPRASLDDAPLSALQLLAAEAAIAIERARLQEELEATARTDALTALANRRKWEEELPRELARAERYGHPVCVALLDLDRFKAFNDLRGHLAGDRLLQDAAAAWSEQLRDVDLLARYGGEEFAVLLPSSGLEEAAEAIDRVRRATPGGQTASAGLALWDRRESEAALLARADRALYRAKDSGRDRTVAGRS